MSFISYAQNYEDVILMRALRAVDAGFYIDVGAQHPRYDSVTKAFYDLGWHGVNIEPVEHWHRSLVAERPRDINLCLAAGPSEGSIELHETDSSGLSTSVLEFAQRHREQGHLLSQRMVPMSTLDQIWEAHAPSQVHFLKIDVEGAEGDVLRGIDLSGHRPWIIVVEATEPNSQVSTHSQWESLLTSRDYNFVYQDGLNRFYLANEHQDLAEAFVLPPNFFDDFIRREFVDRVDELQQHVHEGQELAQRQDQFLSSLVATLAERDETLGAKDQALVGLLDYQVQAEALVTNLRALLAGREESEARLVAELQGFAQQHEQDLALRRELEAMLADSISRSRLLDSEIERLRGRLEQSELSSARLSRLLADAQAAQVSAANAWQDALSAHQATLAELGKTQRDYADVMSSHSWRITAPLRKAKGLLASVLSPIREFARRTRQVLPGGPAAAAQPAKPQAELPLTLDAEAIAVRYQALPGADADGARP